MGLACGDYLGMPVQFMQGTEVHKFFGGDKVFPTASKFGLSKPAGYYSDDTCMMICLAESLVEGFDIKDQFRRYRRWLLEGYATPDDTKAFDVGQRTFIALTQQAEEKLPEILEDHPEQGGNGALMRCAPVALRYYKDPEKLVKTSVKSAIVTHNSSVAAWSCVVLNKLISYALVVTSKDEMLTRLSSELSDYCPTEISSLLKELNQLHELPNTGYSLNTLRIALKSFFESNSFEDCITKTILIGGDTDTQAAVAGALAGAYYGYNGIPSEWRDKLMRREYIEKLAIKLLS